MDETRLARIERKVDALTLSFAKLIAALSDEEDGEPEQTLDGGPSGGERDQSQSL